jgi:hypothetical protein
MYAGILYNIFSVMMWGFKQSSSSNSRMYDTVGTIFRVIAKLLSVLLLYSDW